MGPNINIQSIATQCHVRYEVDFFDKPSEVYGLAFVFLAG